MSDAARWARLEALFDGALDRPADERVPWVRHEAADDPVLLDRVLRMLAAHDRPGVLDARLDPLAESDVRTRLAPALSDRYILGEALGSGGTATVFLAREHKHDRQVVLKVLQPGLAAAIGPARFRDEVRIAAQMAHPHILPLIDSGEADGLLYYVMPFVGGETLRDRLTREGALGVRPAIALLRDIADALASAHAVGVVHRDLKPENILCVGDHAFLLDFGVAKLDGTLGTLSRQTDPGLAIGTPGYMAPEQAAGQPVDHRADLYAWGLVARELLTGSRHPTARVGDRVDVPRTLAALVEATLAIDPAERPARADALVVALANMLTPVQPQRSRWPWFVAAAAGVVLSGLVVRSVGQDTTIAVGALVQPIAVAPLLDESGDPSIAGIGRLAADWITQGLHETGGLRVVAWPAVRAAVERDTTADPVRAVRDAAGAGTVVIGRVYRTGAELRFAVEIVNAERGLVLAAPAPVVVHRDSAMQGVRLLRDRVMGALAVQRDTRLPVGAAFASRPPTYDAYRAFDRALTDYDHYRYEEATTGMLEAWHRDTTFTAALVYAAFAASNAVDHMLADSLVRAALARRTTMGGYHVAMSEHLAASLVGDGPAAFEAARLAATLAPGSRAAYNAARTLLAMNRPAEAESILAGLDPDRGPMQGWPAYWSQRAYSAHLLGRHDNELAFARTMRRRHPEQRVTGVIEARALAAMGRSAELDSLFVASETLSPDTYWSQGAMRTVAGQEFAAHGDPARAGPMLVEAERWLRDRLARVPEHAGHRFWLATGLLAQQRWVEAESLLAGLTREGDAPLRLRGHRAIVAAQRGQADRAQELLTDARPDEVGEQLLYRARVAAILGDDDEALALLAAAIRTGVRLSIGGFHWVHGDITHDLATVGDQGALQRLLAPIPPPSP